MKLGEALVKETLITRQQPDQALIRTLAFRYKASSPRSPVLILITSFNS